MQRNIYTTDELVRANASQFPDSAFVNFYDQIITYKDLDERTNALANYLVSAGMGKGDIVSFQMGNSPEFFYVHLGAQKIGALGGPVSCWWQADEVLYLINDCRPKVMVVDPEYVGIISEIKDNIPSVRHILVNSPVAMDLDFPHQYLPDILNSHSGEIDDDIAISPDDPAAIMYTSGTTGHPKGVLLTHKGITYGAEIKIAPFPIIPGDRTICVLPLFHSGGLNDLSFPAIYAGATIVLRKNFSAGEFWECVEKYKINAFYIVPTMWNILLRAPESETVNTDSLKFGLSGAAPIPPEQLRECERRFQIPIVEAYGTTENSGGITANHLDTRKDGSIGFSFPGIEVRVKDDDGNDLTRGEIGEICVRGDTVMAGYYNNPEATAETIIDGWLRTGDVGYADEEGFFFLVDRKKEMIIRGGVNVYPKEIENVIATHPKVNIVGVIPVPHDKYGQVAKACVVLMRGETVSQEELRVYCEKRLAAYKVPAHFEILENIPTTAVGKVAKKELIRQLEEEEKADPVPVAHFFEGMPDRFLPDQAIGVEATVSYSITGKGGGKWTVAIKDQKMTLEPGVLKEPTVYIVARDCDYHDIMTGKLDGITAVMTGKMNIEGDLGFMGKLREMMKPVDIDKLEE
jgi:long-chain acyl-CoA synthetase